ncbi:Holliday junction branch migration protein RuvA [Haliangium ochraceum]|uniref:Holliday junction branch migration complex subunit RuvA n=1 Tax=Haliangium ochraceum (strain DSM 14365 / JCM 11303 / SMP-2) TaxID=502025 RepID=D0LZE6_HALO1|nr:Holliday junction branch migration protein RuvA [Haliangium ochraceum]ACY16408.1 Holliday junction DNA helicase RuvA [Haliangium ochraceum DSM 14365]
MIGRLRGTLVEQEGSMVIVECGGVGYEVTVSIHTLQSLPAEGEPVTLRIFTHALESRVALYGFGSTLERDLFDLLITVKKVGPSSAVGILSAGSGPAEIAEMIANGETSSLTRLRGVGKKTAEMLVVELREKCELLLATHRVQGGRAAARAPAAAARPSSRGPLLDEVAQALLQLGWRQQSVDQVVSELAPTAEDSLESLLRQALRAMPR